MKVNRHNCRRSRAFTLLEVLLAVGIFAIVLFAMNTVFFGALRLERSTNRLVDERQSLNQAFAILRRDLLGAVPPKTNSYLLTRDFLAGASSRGLGSSQASSLEFYTTTGQISDAAPWSELQRVRYELVSPLNPAGNPGQELVRVVTRNVLATTTEEEEEQLLLSNVERIEFLCYNGTDWRETWDTTAADVGLPLAVRVRVQLANTNNPNAQPWQEPLELVVPVATQSLTNQLAGGAQ